MHIRCRQPLSLSTGKYEFSYLYSFEQFDWKCRCWYGYGVAMVRSWREWSESGSNSVIGFLLPFQYCSVFITSSSCQPARLCTVKSMRSNARPTVSPLHSALTANFRIVYSLSRSLRLDGTGWIGEKSSVQTKSSLTGPWWWGTVQCRPCTVLLWAGCHSRQSRHSNRQAESEPATESSSPQPHRTPVPANIAGHLIFPTYFFSHIIVMIWKTDKPWRLLWGKILPSVMVPGQAERWAA